MTSFAEARAIEARDPGVFAAQVPPDWVQGRTAFGGLGAALMIDAAATLPEAAGLPVRSVDVAFIGPLPPGPTTVTARVVRAGRYLVHIQAAVGDDPAHPAATAHVVMGRQRPATVTVVPQEDPQPAMAEGVPMPFLPGLTPEFTRNLEYVFCLGQFPFTGSDRGELGGFCRHRDPAPGAAAVAALVDGWPPSVAPMLSAPAPASSVRWSMHFPDDGPFDGAEWHWYRARTVVAGGGYASATAELRLGDRLVLWSEQLYTVFEKPPA